MVQPENSLGKEKKRPGNSLNHLSEDRELRLRRALANQEETEYLSSLQHEILEKGESPYNKASSKAIKQGDRAGHESETGSNSGKDTVESELLGSLHDFQLEPQVSPKRVDVAKESPGPKPEVVEQIGLSVTPSTPPVESHPVSSAPSIQPGTIVTLEDETVGIFEKEIPDKEYDILLIVKPDGTLEPKGVSLYAYQWRQIGSIPPDLLAQMIRRMRWERDALIYHLDRYEYAHLIPNQKASPRKSEQVPPETRTSRANTLVEPPVEPTLQRGRVISIEAGNKTWNAVYWGSNNMGAIVAHNTHKTWSLMHLDLKRFEGLLKYGDLLDAETIRKIEADLTKNRSLD